MSVHVAMKTAMVAKIHETSYFTPPFTPISELEWESNMPEDAAREVMGVQEALALAGQKIVDWVIFRIAGGHRCLAGNPKALFKSLEVCLSSEEILKAIFIKIDPRAIHNVKKIPSSFKTFLGSSWDQLELLNRDTAILTDWLTAILAPLVPVATSAYMDQMRASQRQSKRTRPPSAIAPTQTSNVSQTPVARNPSGISTAHLSYDCRDDPLLLELTFLRNIRQLQYRTGASELAPPEAPTSPQPPVRAHAFADISANISAVDLLVVVR
ncbi:hypothetical protein FB451DRAFT_1384292 [Mycena latifolia]|nr:hypothetical protein FB451DRAFT_1384292 [Mycena latifolia]